MSSSFSVATSRGSGNAGTLYFFPNSTVDLVGDLERVLENVGTLREVLRDLRRALEVQPAIVVHAVGVAAILAESDAEQHVVRVVVLGA